MNQGLFGLPPGPGGVAGVRKLAGQVRSGFNTGGSSFSTALAAAGLNPSGATTLALTSGVRTRALSINGRGAARFALVNNAVGGTSDVRVEVFVDGVRAIDTGSLSLPAGGHMPFIGGVGATNVSAALDFVPFDSTLEIWITASAGGNYQHGFLIDLHQ